jgi:hypothetical protein
VDPKFKKYKLNGQLYLWHYRDNLRNYPGWNITIDDKGCDSLIDLFNQMEYSKYSSQVTLVASVPTRKQVRRANDDARFYHARYLELKFRKGIGSYWQLTESPTTLMIQFGERKMIEFKGAVAKLKNREDDFAICNEMEDDESILYFWLHLNN